MCDYNIFYCSTVYHVLIASLIAYQYKDKKNILIVNITSFECGKNLRTNNDTAFFDVIYTLEDQDLVLAKKEFLNYKKNITEKMEILIPDLRKYKKAHSSVQCFICEDDHHFSRYFVYNFTNIIMLEEGIKIYTDISKRESILKKIIKYYLLGINYPNGVDKHIKEIWVQYPDRLPINIKNKGRKLDLFKLMKPLSGTNSQKILSKMLGIDNSLWLEVNDLFNNRGSNIILLITQPFSEDGYISEEQKYEIYSAIINKFCRNKQIVIKPHPREITNYKEKFPQALILNNGFPLELLNFLNSGKKIDEAITVNSTAIMNIKGMCNHIRVIGLCEWTKALKIACSLSEGYYI